MATQIHDLLVNYAATFTWLNRILLDGEVVHVIISTRGVEHYSRS